MKKIKIIVFLTLLLIVAFAFAQIISNVYFQSDTILRLEGIPELYIKGESRANQVQIRKVLDQQHFEVFGIPDGQGFILRTDGTQVLNFSPQGGTVDFGFASNDFDQYLRRWQEQTSDTTVTVTTNHILGGLVPGGFYRIEVNGMLLKVSSADLNGEVSFSRQVSPSPNVDLVTLNPCNYKPQGSLTSRNLLYGKDAREIREFFYTASIPQGTSISVQFSRDGTSWFNSQGEANGWDSLSDGSHSIDLWTNLQWQGTNLPFYYRARLSSPGCLQTPILEKIEVSFITIK